ncbi:MAG: hypothetical protein AVDCRST_MAG77-101 [uncultured Chloroflexi bacterium]|uniref:Uncharacterized protein n=1 Tax=uncultured Chloroflexota bacterium TaxID=166587 RepID=A0A6J4H721_9CHLR|nr:MAG: hypothetical protein AVDCRST_MAG77-101 [uncultured Chloroflexota bacterium]
MTPTAPVESSHDPPAPPRWARVAAALLVVTSLAVLVVGRGGTAVLAGVCLAFGALAVLLLSMPDRLPHDE